MFSSVIAYASINSTKLSNFPFISALPSLINKFHIFAKLLTGETTDDHN